MRTNIPCRPKRLRLAAALPADREPIFQLRHEVYALELRQYRPNDAGRLTDDLDGHNHYLCAWEGERLVGFISITPPGRGGYSIDTYIARERLPFTVDERLYEVRVLTVTREARGREVAALLMYAALRWVESRGGTQFCIPPALSEANLRLPAGCGTGDVWLPLMSISTPPIG